MSFVKGFVDTYEAIYLPKATKVRHPSPAVVLENGKIREIRVRQHLLRLHQYKFNKVELCWRRLWHTGLLRDVEEETTASQLKGLYFESHCIGGTAHGRIDELPRLRNGNKSVDHQRIDEQIFNFESIMDRDKYGIILLDNGSGEYKNCQVKQRKRLDLEDFEDIRIFLEGTADIISPFEYGGYSYKKACIDLKLTLNRNNTFGPFAWGDPSSMDHTQAYVYSYLFEMPFLYWIFDFNSKDRGEKIVPVNTDIEHPDSNKAKEARMRFTETMQSIRTFCADVLHNEAMDWPTNPKYSRCKNCPIFDCKDRREVEEV